MASISDSVFIVMGVSGCGKTTLARVLAERTGGTWLDADDFHPPKNKAKMSAGVPLSDEDRWPWLDALHARLKAGKDNKPLFLACSALKQTYRDRLSNGLSKIHFVYLKGTLELIQNRLLMRSNHFMPAQLLESQFAVLEEPSGAITLDVALPPEKLVDIFIALTARLPGS